MINELRQVLRAFLKWLSSGVASTDNTTELKYVITETKKDEVPPSTKTESTPPLKPVLSPTEPLWDTPANARHSVRVICDNKGLSFKEKELICAVIMAESGFKNGVVNNNRNAKGVITSTDWGIVQCNDRFWIGENKKFPSVDYVLEHPGEMVSWMIDCYRAGHLDWWCAYQNKSYLAYLK